MIHGTTFWTRPLDRDEMPRLSREIVHMDCHLRL